MFHKMVVPMSGQRGKTQNMQLPTACLCSTLFNLPHSKEFQRLPSLNVLIRPTVLSASLTVVPRLAIDSLPRSERTSERPGAMSWAVGRKRSKLFELSVEQQKLHRSSETSLFFFPGHPVISSCKVYQFVAPGRDENGQSQWWSLLAIFWKTV